MWRSPAVGVRVGMTAVVAICWGVGCDRRPATPVVSTTEITAAQTTTPEDTRGDDVYGADLGAYRESALGDLANLDARLHRLETRAATREGVPPEAFGLLEDARRHRDELSLRIERMQPTTWRRERDDVQARWEEVSAMVEGAGDLLSERAK